VHAPYQVIRRLQPSTIDTHSLVRGLRPLQQQDGAVMQYLQARLASNMTSHRQLHMVLILLLHFRVRSL
jgi:hypothetical protein